MLNYRVVHLPTSAGGNPQGLSKHLRVLGLDSVTWIFRQDVFNYPGTKTLWNEGDGALRREMLRWYAIIRVALSFDVIHFNYGSSWASPVPMFSTADKGARAKAKRFFVATYLRILSFAELGLYRMFRRPMFVHYQGDDARQGDFSRAKFRYSIAQYADEGYYSAETDALKRRMICRMSRYCARVYAVNPDLMHVLGPGARFIPYSHISLDEWRPVYTQLERRPLRIGHAPSHRKVKGTDFILTALEKLAAEGYEFELVLIEGMSNDQARRKYEQVDVLIDQLHAGWYGGVAVEAMALGKPVMTYIRDEDLQFIPSEMKADLPILRVTVESIKEDLRRLLQMPRDELYALAQRSRRYVERWHDPLRIAEEIKQDYEEALRAKRRATTDATMRRALLLAVGSGVGPLTQLLATPWLARLYQPADFGNLALFMSAAGIAVTISCLRYETTITTVVDEDVHAGVWTAVGSALALCLMLFLVVAFHVPQILSPQLDELGQKMWGVPLFGICGGFLLVGMQLTLRRAEFKFNAFLRSAQTVLFVLLALLFTDLGLVNISILSATVVALVVILYLIKSVPKVGPRKLWRFAREHTQYPLLMVPTSLLDAAALAVPVFFISNAYGVGATGHYFQIQKLIGAPLVLLAVVAGQLFLKRSGEIYRSGQSSKLLLWRTIGALSLTAGALLVFLTVGGEYLLGLLLGDAWRVDTVFLLLAIAPLLCRVIVSPVSSVFITHDQVGVGVRWQLGYFVSTVSVLYLASIHLPFEYFLAIYALHEAAVYSAYLYMANLASQRIRMR